MSQISLKLRALNARAIKQAKEDMKAEGITIAPISKEELFMIRELISNNIK